MVVGAIAVAVILKSTNQEKEPEEGWKVEIWNIYRGYCVAFGFSQSMVLGRSTILQNVVLNFPVEEDRTISRDHVLLYEQNKILWAWNISKVNVACINDCEITVPRQLSVGARLKMGDSVFLVTKIEKSYSMI